VASSVTTPSWSARPTVVVIRPVRSLTQASKVVSVSSRVGRRYRTLSSTVGPAAWASRFAAVKTMSNTPHSTAP